MTKSLMMLGLRGVGKTVLLNRIQQMADDAGCVTGFIEAEGRQALPDLLTPHLWRILLKLDTQKRARESVHRAFRLLRGFASAFSVQFGGIEVGIKPETATGDLSLDVTDLLVAVGEAAAQRGSPVVILIDEVQYLSGDELSAIMIALHRVSQKQLPLLLFGAGLPQLAALAGEAKSYAERLFFFNEIGRLSNEAGRTAIMEPLRQENVAITDDAVEAILAETNCYPFFLQLWGYYAWESAEASPISVEDVNAATDMSIEDLDQGFFNIRYQRLTDRQRDYVFALARLGPGPAGPTERGRGEQEQVASRSSRRSWAQQAAQRGRSGADRAAQVGRGGQHGQEQLPGQHVPRDPHPAQRHHGDDRTGPDHRNDRRAAGVSEHGQNLR